MNLLEIPRRLALVLALQIAACVYAVLSVGALIKARQIGDQEMLLPISDLSLWIKTHGWMLMALPLAWYWLHVRYWMKAGADWTFLTKVVVSGLAVFAAIVCLALLGSSGVFRVNIHHGHA